VGQTIEKNPFKIDLDYFLRVRVISGRIDPDDQPQNFSLWRYWRSRNHRRTGGD
jgi:hypothetical protein